MVIVPTLTFGPSSILKTSFTALVAAMRLVGWLHGGELVPMFGQQSLDHHFGAYDYGGIELAFDRQADFLVLEGVKDVRFRNGFVSLVLDTPNDRPSP